MKAVSLSRRLLAIILCFVLCCTYLPATAAAADIDALYGIAANEDTTITELSELDDESVLDAFSEEAALLNYGIEAKIVNWMIQFEKTGQYVSPFSMKATGSNGIASFTMDRPEFNSALEQAGLKGTYKIAVQDASSSTAPVLFLPTTEDSGKLNVSIPISASGVNCALFYVLPDDVIQVITVDEPINAETPSSIYENSAGSPFSVEWTTKLKFNDVQGVHLYPEMPLHGSVILKAPTGITFNAKSVSVESDFLEITEIIPQNDGSILVNLGETSEFSELEFTARDEMINTDISISCDAYLDSDAFIAEGTISMPYVQLSIGSKAYNEGEPQPPLYFAISVISDIGRMSTMKSAVTIKPANMTIYQGGDEGYEGVYDDGQTNLGSDSLPHPLFEITPAKGTNIEPTALTFTNGEKSWTVVETEDPDLYYFEPAGEHQDPVRVTYTDQDGKSVTNDEFNVEDVGNTYAEYAIDLYPGANDFNTVRAKTATNQEGWPISVNSGTLTVRAVENSDPTSPILSEVPASVTSGSAKAVVPAGGTTYTLNDTDVVLPKDSAPSLLFDNIIESDGKPRVDALEDAVDTALGTTDGIRHYEAKYLDLVDANNGNAWISSSEGIDIYWGYPATTDKNTNFTLVHFKDLHRDGNNSGFNLDDIDSDNVDVLTAEEGDIENTDNGIKFHVGKGGFSPFVLVWETAAEEPDPGPDPNPGGGGDSHSDPTGNLTISLGGNGGNEDFIFTVIFTDEDGDELENNFYYNGDYTGTIGSGDEITLTGGDKIVIRNLPEGTRYEVIIETADGYTATSTGAEGVIRTSGNEAAFSVTPTVVLADPSVTGVTRWLNTTDHMAYLSGYPGGTFGPDNSMTRAEVAQMFYALLLNKDVTITKTFSDVPADAWYATAVNTLASLGMVSGDPDGAFRPNDPITRAEFCVIALAFAYEPDNAVCYFGDVSRSDWFYTYVAQAASYGWIGGYANGNFGPNDQITRAQVTTIVNNMLGRAADRDYVIDHQADLVQFSDLTRAHWGYFQIMEATNAHNYTKSNGTESWR